MSLLKKLFGGASTPSAKPETYEGFSITVEPIKEAGGFRVAAHIEKEVDGVLRTHHLIRADLCNSEQECRDISLAKAKILIDQNGDGLFG